MGLGGWRAAEQAARDAGSLGAKAGAQAATLALPTRQQPSTAPSPLTSGEGREQRQRTIAIVFQDFLRASSSSAVEAGSCPATPAAAPQSHCTQSCADTGGDMAPVPIACHPTIRAWSPLAERWSRHPQHSYPMHCSSCLTPQYHRASPRCSGTGTSSFP